MQEFTNVVQSLKDFITETGKKQSEIARALGMSTAVISQFLSGQYTGDNDGLADKLSKYIMQEQPKSGLPEMPPFTMIKAAKQVFAAANYAYKYNDISLVYGRAGVGKTKALHEYARQHTGVVYAVIRDCDKSTSAACKRILKALNKRATGTQSELLDAVIDTLGFSNRLLIIDEAQHLTTKAIDNLRSLNDEGNIPIIFAGNPKVYENMFGRDEQDLDQIFSRMGMIQEIKDKPLISDIQSMFEKFQLDNKCIDILHSTACNKGVLRHMVKAYRRAVTVAASKKEPLSEKHFI